MPNVKTHLTIAIFVYSIVFDAIVWYQDNDNINMNTVKQQPNINSSLSCILRITLPLMLSALSSGAMLFVDRCVLAYYSIDSMNAAMIAGNLVGIFSFVLGSIAYTTEIFVGQFNGSAQNNKIAIPVWQMIYFSIGAGIVLLPIGYFADVINLIPSYYLDEAVPYQRLLTYFCWLSCLIVTFSGFFVGRGNSAFVTNVVIIGNIINLILDVVFVFGYKNIIPSMGCQGAAIATVVSQAAQVIIFACVFWNRQNRTQYATHKNYHFNKPLFMQAVRIGSPLAIGKFVELIAWYLIYAALGHASKDLVTIHGVALNIYSFFIFICAGMTKGSAAMSANFIGQRNLQSIYTIFRKQIWIVIALCSITMFPFLIDPNKILSLVGALKDDLSHLYPEMRIVLRLQFICMIIDSLCAIPLGILMSGGDTRYPNIINLALLWGLVVIPVLSLFCCGHLTSVSILYALSIVRMICYAFLLYRRYRSLKWYNDVENGKTIEL